MASAPPSGQHATAQAAGEAEGGTGAKEGQGARDSVAGGAILQFEGVNETNKRPLIDVKRINHTD